MTTYPLKIDAEIWNVFKAVVYSEGSDLKTASRDAILEYIEHHKPQAMTVNVSIVEDVKTKTDLLQFIQETELTDRISKLMEAIRLKKNPVLIRELKFQVVELVKKNPTVSKTLAEEIRTVFQNMEVS